ncbi:recombinase family protein [Fusobacterium sp.]|uniref:recombinase family protein n=1 Tax=Fusobacterium sp. TaxID=68766 RepID=UPI002A80F97C|nr:recombinase family protein [Fusobacterium sp.]
MNRAVAYCRFSSSNQREESIEAQIRAITEYCKIKKLTLVKIYKDEAISGTSVKNRENFMEMIADSKNKNFDYVIVHKYDRFARNRYDHAIYEKKLNDNNVKLLSVLEEMTDSPENVILKSVLTGMNEYYSLNLSREVKKGQKENALKAIHNGGIVPLGYTLDENRKYVINEEEAKIVKLIFNLALNGVGYASIAATLNEKGYKNKLGKDFKKTSIRDMLLNQKYIGTYFFGLRYPNGKLKENPIIIHNSHEAIIQEDVFYKVQERFKNSKKKPRKRGRNDYVLTGYCTCGLCGGTYSGGYRTKNRHGVAYYGYECRCRRAKVNNCKNKSINKELLENIIFDTIKKKILNDENIKNIAKDLITIINEKINVKTEEIKKCEKELEKLQKLSLKLLEKNLEGIIVEEVFNIKNQEINNQIYSHKQKLYSLRNIHNVEVDEEAILKYLYDLKKDSEDKIKRTLVETFVQNIKIYPDKLEICLNRFPKIMGKDGTPRGCRSHKYATTYAVLL